MLSHARFQRALTTLSQKTNLGSSVNARSFSTSPEQPKANIDVDKVIEEAKKDVKKESFLQKQKKNIASNLLNNQGSMKFYTVYGLSAFAFFKLTTLTNSAISLLQDLEFSEAVVANGIYAAGISHTLIALGMIKLAAYITSLAGRPSEAVIQEVLDHTRTHPMLLEKLGGSAVPGQFSTVSTLDGGPRFWDDRSKIYDDWLRFRLAGEVDPVNALPFPNQMKPIIDWLNGAKLMESIRENKQKLKKMNQVLDAKSVAYVEKNDVRIRTQKSRNDYSGWEAYWKPRRLQFVCHLTSADASKQGILIAEIEKAQTGLGAPGSGGFARYKTLQFVDLATGEVSDLEGSERPTLLNHAQLSKLFDTIPAAIPTEANVFTQGVTISKLDNPVVPPTSSATSTPKA